MPNRCNVSGFVQKQTAGFPHHSLADEAPRKLACCFIADGIEVIWGNRQHLGVIPEASLFSKGFFDQLFETLQDKYLVFSRAFNSAPSRRS